MVTGVVSCRVTLANGSHPITVQAGGYYAGSRRRRSGWRSPRDKVTAIGFVGGTVFAIDNRYAEIVYSSGGRAFRISADDVESLGFSSDGRRAELRASADLWDITKILRPVRVGGGLTLQVALSESGRGGTIAFSLWDGDTLVYEQPEKPLAGGFVTIR